MAQHEALTNPGAVRCDLLLVVHASKLRTKDMAIDERHSEPSEQAQTAAAAHNDLIKPMERPGTPKPPHEMEDDRRRLTGFHREAAQELNSRLAVDLQHSAALKSGGSSGATPSAAAQPPASSANAVDDAGAGSSPIVHKPTHNILRHLCVPGSWNIYSILLALCACTWYAAATQCLCRALADLVRLMPCRSMPTLNCATKPSATHLRRHSNVSALSPMSAVGTPRHTNILEEVNRLVGRFLRGRVCSMQQNLLCFRCELWSRILYVLMPPCI